MMVDYQCQKCATKFSVEINQPKEKDNACYKCGAPVLKGTVEGGIGEHVVVPLRFVHVMDVKGQAIHECLKCGALVREEKLNLHTEHHEWVKDCLRATIDALQVHIG